MKQQTKRLIALVLFAVMVFGIIPVIPGDVTAATYVQPTEATENLLSAEKYNSSFEVTEPSSLTPKGWKRFTGFADRDWFSFQVTEREDGGSCLKYTVAEGATTGTHAIYSEAIPVADLQGKYLFLTFDVKGDRANVALNAYVYFYTNDNEPTGWGSQNVASDGTNGTINAVSHVSTSWKTVSNSSNGYYTNDKMRVPSDATYARVFFYKAYSGVGTVYIDNVTLKPICNDGMHTYNKGYASTGFYSHTACQTVYYKRCDNCDFFRQMTDTRYHVVSGEPHHNVEKVPAKESTADEAGNIEYWICKGCSKWYTTADATQEITDKNSVFIGKKFGNLLEDLNPSFEGAISGDDPEHWTTYDSSNKFHSVVDTEAKTGTHALKLYTDSTAPAPRGIKSGYATLPPLMTDGKVSLLFYSKGEGSAQAYIYFYDANKNKLSNVAGEPTYINISPTDRWASNYGCFTVPTGAVYVQIMLYKSNSAAGQGVMYFDDVIIKEYQSTDGPIHELKGYPAVAPTADKDGNIAYWECQSCGKLFSDAAATTQITNPGSVVLPKRYSNLLAGYNASFEDGVSNGDDPLLWTPYSASSPNYYGVTTEDAKVGTHSLKVSVTEEGVAPKGIYSSKITVKDMEAITLLFYSKGDSTSMMYMYFFDAAMNQLDTHEDNKTWFLIMDSQNWSSNYAKFTVPEDAMYAQIMIYKPSSGDHFGTSYFDDIIIKEYQTIDGPLHKLTAHEAVKPTVTSTGSLAYWSCDDCGKLFSDAYGMSEVDPNAVLLPKRYSNLMEGLNGSFEDGIVNDDDPIGWEPYSQASPESYSVTTEEAKVGTHSLKLFTAREDGSPRGVMSGYFKVADMEYIAAYFDVKGDSIMSMYMYFYDGIKQKVANVEGESIWIPGNPGKDWTACFGKFTVPEGAMYARVMFYKSHNEPGVDYIDNVVVKEYEDSDGIKLPIELNESFEDGENKSGLPWGWTYYTVDTQPTDDTKWVEILEAGNKNNPADAPANAPAGDHYLRFTQVEQDPDVGKIRGIYSPYIDVSNMKAVATTIDMTGLGTTQVYIMFYDVAYHCPENAEWRLWGIDEYANDWGQYYYEAAVPEGAKYARLLICKSFRTPYPGTVYLDKVTLKETELLAQQIVYPPVPEEIHYDYQIVEADHPRVFFGAAELRRLKRWIQNDSLTSFGYSGKDAYNELLADADKYLAETNLRIAFTSHTVIDVPMYPKLEDISVWPVLETAPGPGYATPYPYLTRINLEIKDRAQCLALAYVLSGNEAYAERAIQYAVDFCEWKCWSKSYKQHLDNLEADPDCETTAQPLGYVVTTLATVYDMCYNLLTESQKATIETNLIERGLEPIYKDVAKRMARGRDDDGSAVMYTAACAIINEENLEQISKYLDRELQYTNWVFDWYDMGHNEGYDYAANGIDQAVEGMAMVERVTGVAGHLEHHFFQVTLPAWIKGFIDMGSGTMVGYSDSPYWPEFSISLGVLAKYGEGDQAAGYCLYVAGGAELPFDKLLYTNISDDYIMIPDDDYMNVTVVDVMGVGSLRTGWETMDKLMVMISDDYGVGHAHWEANSIFMAMNGEWIIKDPGYGSIQTGVPKTEYDMKYASNTIFVDNKAQTIKGAGHIEEVVNSEHYGHILGSAPNAYGKYDGVALVDKFDRHTIMMNHDSESYYIVIDDLASSQEHIFGFNMHHSAWDRLELDGKQFDTESTTPGNHLALLRYGMVLHYNFIGNQLDFSAPYFTKAGEKFGPLLRANSKSTKEHQFMTVISVDPQYAGITTIDATGTLTGRNSKLQLENPDGWSWSSSNDGGSVIALPMPEHGLNMFRARDVGDWMSFVFEVEEAGDYLFSLRLGSWPNYGGLWQAYLDGEPIGDLYAARSNKSSGVNVAMTKNDGNNTINLTAGKHVIKMVLAAEPRTDDLEWGTLISMGVVVLEKEGASLGDGPVKVLESYDEGDTLGATIQYGTVLKDIVLSNRGNGTISGGNLTTNGQQATVMGLYGDKITEGFTILNGTSAKFGETTLIESDGEITMAVDYTLVRPPVLNIVVDEEYIEEEDEDFDPKKPTTWVTTSAEEPRKVSIQVGYDAPYTANVDGVAIDSTYADGLLTLTVPSGDHKIEIVGTHKCVFDQKSTDISQIKTWATCEQGNVFYISCYCGEHGEETFTSGNPRGHKIIPVAAKAAQDHEDGCIAHFACKNCDKVFADAEGEMEMKLSDVIIPKLISDAPAMDWIIWVAVGGVVLLGAAAVAFVLFKKKKAKK